MRAVAFVAAVACGALLGFAFDDPAQRTLNACARDRTARRRTRMLFVAVLLASCWAAVVIAAEARGADLGPVSGRLPEAIAAAALASAFAAVGLRTGVATPGLGAAVIAALVMTASTGMSSWSSRLRWLPQVANPDHSTRWWLPHVANPDHSTRWWLAQVANPDHSTRWWLAASIAAAAAVW